ncbi:MAG TPA: serine/threonine-protein kinase, partial [Methylomirabilota bacterium]|nr:serine/threonine-protein kinase [Methylomirabilota bacterium]
VGEHEGQHYFSMELVTGRTLAELVREKPLPPRDAARLVQVIAEAVEFAHCRGVLHRDLKPSNVLLDAAGQPRITDFGLAKRLASDLTPRPSDLTLTGQVLGSPNFMPPEQAEPKRGPVTAASDVYSLGAILYHLLTGRPPFLAETFEETLLQLLHREPVAPRLLHPGVPADLETICLKCLAKEPAKRYATAQALADELSRFLRDEPILARPAGLAEKLWRWCRRQPAFAALWGGLVAALLGGIFGITWQWRRAEASAEDARREAERAEANAREARGAEANANEQLWRSLLAQARAERRTGEAGQRHGALKAVARAAAMRPSLELRNEALAALALPDLEFVPIWTNRYSVSVFDFSADQQRFAVATAGGRIRIFQTGDTSKEDVLPAVGGWAQRLWFSPDARFVAASYSTGSNVVWDAATKTKVLGWGPSSRLAVFTPDCRRLLIPRDSGSIHCVSMPDGRELWRCQARAGLWSPVVQLQQRYFAYHREGGREVEVRDLDSGERVRAFEHSSPVSCVAWSPDGQRLLVGLETGWIGEWEVNSDADPERWKAHDDAVVTLAFAPSGEWLVSSAWDSTVRLWKWSGRALAVTAHGYRLHHPRFSADARWLAGGTRHPLIGRFEVSNSTGFRRLLVPPSERRGAWSVDVSPDGQLVVAGYAEGLWILNLASGRVCGFQSVRDCRSVAFTPDGQSLLTCGEEGLARWRLERALPGNANEIRLGPRQGIRNGVLKYAAITADGRWAGAADFDRDRLVFHEINTPANQFKLTNHENAQFVAISSDGRWVASGSWYGSGVRIWDLSTRSLVRELPVNGSATVAFSPDSRLLASGSQRCQVWEVGSWRELHRTESTADMVLASAFSPDGRILAITKGRRSVQLLEPASGQVLAELEAPGAAPLSWLRFTPDGASLLALEWTRDIQVWDLRRLRAELAALKLDWESPPSPAGLK